MCGVSILVLLMGNPIPKALNVTTHSVISKLKKMGVGRGNWERDDDGGGGTFIMIFDCNIDGSNVIAFVSSSSSGA
jgi:hypothetical protein